MSEEDVNTDAAEVAEDQSEETDEATEGETAE